MFLLKDIDTIYPDVFAETFLIYLIKLLAQIYIFYVCVIQSRKQGGGYEGSAPPRSVKLIVGQTAGQDLLFF